MIQSIQRGALAALVLGSLVLGTGCGGSTPVAPKPAGTPDPRLERAGLRGNTGAPTPEGENKGGGKQNSVKAQLN